MKMNRVLLSILFVLTVMISSVSAYDFYSVYTVSFTDEPVSDFYVNGAVCGDSQCSTVTSNSITLLDSQAFTTCVDNYNENFDYDTLVTCLADAELDGNLVDISNLDYIVTKESNAANSFGALTYFMTQGDTYVPVVSQGIQYPADCSRDDVEICFDTNNYNLEFSKINEAIAEVGQLNIKNVDNPLKPIQVEVPVQIEETVCSAYRFANENYWTPSDIPQGYSDFDAMTQIDLLIQDENGTTLLEDQVVVPIEAETCAGLTAFSWTPSAGLENEEITFTVTTEVIDTQVITSLIDYATVTETVYPENLDGTCWVRAYDFTLANEPTFDLTSSLAQIQQGEFLYAGFNGGAWRDESITPMQFEALFIFDDGTTETVVSSLQDTSGITTQAYFEDLSQTIANLQPGNYEVTLVTRPQGPNCIISEDVTQTQQLTILEIPRYSLDVFVTGNESQFLEDVSINLELEESRDEFQVTPTYDRTQNTNTNGYSEFTNMIAGTYTYTASKDGYNSVTNEIIIGSDSQLYINLPQTNIAPIVDLPEGVSLYFEETVELNLQSYVVDFNDAFSSLDITAEIVSGQATEQIVNGNTLEVSTTTPNTVVVRVTAEDSQGLSSSDTMQVEFVNNVEPSIIRFEADPTNGEQPFSTTFLIEVEDQDLDTLTCTIDFDDGTIETFACAEYDGIIEVDHTFNEIGQYNTVLTVEDGIHSVTSLQRVFVFERTFAAPQILTFNFDSSKGEELPTNLELDWTITHPDDLPMSCTLRINGVNNAVDCNGNFELIDFATPGVNVFTLIASDGEREDIRRIERSFFIPEDNAPTASLVADVTSGIISLDVNFNISVEDDNDNLSELLCRLDFGDGDFIESACDELLTASHTYSVTTFDIAYRAQLRVVDTVGNEVIALSDLIVVQSNDGPIVNDFTYTSSNNLELPTNLNFSFDATHSQGLAITCSLIINGVPNTVDCTGSFAIENYSVEGVASFIFVVTDENGVESQIELNPNFVRINIVPVIEIFTSSETSGFTNVTTNFTYQISDADGDNLTYTLSFDDLTADVRGNQNSGVITHTYTTFGIFDATLTVTDGIDTVSDSIQIQVLDPNAEGNRPNANLLLETQDGTFILPNTVTLTSIVSHPRSLATTCDLITPLGTQFDVDCNGQFVLNNFNVSGVSNFTLVATDSNGIVTTDSIVQEFFTPEEAPDLTLEMVALDIEPVITPGNFGFSLRTINETLAKRELFVQPVISCSGITYVYEQGTSFLSTSALSAEKLGDEYRFPIQTDTVDYLGAIPTDKTCLFNVRIIDAFGTDVTIVKDVMFSYPESIIEKPSIDGFGTDVMDFISGTINQEFTTGYNKVEFTLVNHESETKEITISLSSTKLGLGYNEEVNLGPDSVKDVSVPLLFTKDQKGTFPVRIAINDGKQKQVKYSYITIK